MTEEDAEVNPKIVTGTLPFYNTSARILIDTGSDKSYIKASLALELRLELVSLGYILKVKTPLEEVLYRDQVYKNVEIVISGVNLPADLIPLNMEDFDLLLGMDWLSFHRASVNCFTKVVSF